MNPINPSTQPRTEKNSTLNPLAMPPLNKSFVSADEVRPFVGHGQLHVLKFSDDVTIGRGVFEPGWKWSVDVKPLAGTSTCEASHSGYCLEGSMTIRMDDGREIKLKAGDAFHIPPGHDAWVDGKERCVLIDVGGFKNYAVKDPSQKSPSGSDIH